MKGIVMRIINKFLPVVIILTGFISTAEAGFLDKLNAATQKLNEKTQQMQNRPAPGYQKSSNPDEPLHLEEQYKGSCYGKQSATCMDYGELVDQCMEPLKGYRMKLTGDLIEKKLKTEKLNDKQRKNLEEDLAAAREAEKNKTDNPTIAGQKNSQRYLQDISEEDQVYINAEYNVMHQKITNKCIGADHMNTGRRTNLIKEKALSGEEVVAEYKNKKAKDEEPFNCLKGVSGVRYNVMADMMEKKMTASNLSDKDRADWQADIASLREAAAAGGTAMPKPVDPANPMRAMMRMTKTEDMMALSQETSKQTQELIESCNNKNKPPKPKMATGSAKGYTTTSEMKKLNAENAEKDKKDAAKQEIIGGGGSLGAGNLTYMKTAVKCYEPMKGHMAKVTAAKLEEKLKTAKNVTPENRKLWEEDIAAWKEAAAVGADQPDPPDPDNPYRWQDWLTNQERQQINSEHAAFVNQITRECNAKEHMK